MALTLSTPWNELLDAASVGGLECHVTLAEGGFGSLCFEIWLPAATPAGLVAANLATALFDIGGQSSREIFDHCFGMGAVYRNYSSDDLVHFRGPMRGALPLIVAGVSR